MMMKKLLALILALMMTVCLFAACGEKEETAGDDATVEVKALAEDALALLVARDSEGMFNLTVDPDPTASANSALKGKFDAYDKVVTNFEAQVDGWELSEELAADIKEYGKTKAEEVYASFAAKEVTNAVQTGDIINVNAKADLLNVTGEAYAAIYTDITVYTDGKEIKDMTIDELKVVTDKIFEAIQVCVVDTDVAFQYKKEDNTWKINYVGISAAE